MSYTYSFISRSDAETFLKQLKDIMAKHKNVTVADVKDIRGEVSIYSDITQGWNDLSSVKVEEFTVNSQKAYRVILPEPASTKTLLKHFSNVDDNKVTTNTTNNKRANDYECADTMVSHPGHYQAETGLEVIDVIEAFTFDLKGIEATDTGNVIKYICRWKKKNGLQDLNKAMWYLQHLINHVQKLEKENK